MIDFNAIPGSEKKFGQLSDELHLKLDEVSDEFFKKGTLASDTLDWSLIEARSREILQQASHMLAFRGLILALVEKKQINALVNALDCTRVLLKNHYPKLHPKGKKYQKMKANWAAEIISVISKASDVFIHDLMHEKNKEIATDFCKQAELHEFDVSSLKRKLSEKPIQIRKDEAEIRKAVHPSAEQAAMAEAKDLDAKGRAQLRRDIQSLAHRIFSHDPDAGISYEMRGYVGWMEFQFLPEADENGTTHLQKIPNSLYEEHKRACSNATVNELYRLEERLMSNPDWFEGHRLAYDTALNLGLEEAAKAITRRVQHRLEQWPKLLELKYSNNISFVDDDIKQWALSAIHQAQPDDANLEDEEDSLEALVSSVNASIETSKSTRDQAMAKYRLLKGFKKMGYSSQAKIMAGELISDITTLAVKDWDQNLLREIEVVQKLND